MRLPIICFSERDLEEVEKKIFRNENKGYSISIKKIEGWNIVEGVKYLGDFSPRYQCYPILPEDCSNCPKAEATICSRWWLVDWADDRPIDEEDRDWAYEAPVSEKDNPMVDNYQEVNIEVNIKLLQMKVWSKKNKSARTLAFIGSMQKDEHTYRCALVLAQLGYDNSDWAREVYNSDIPWMSEFLPEVIELPSGRKEVKIFKKSLNKVLRDTQKLDPSVRGVWIAFISGYLAQKWGLSQEILQSWLEKIAQKL